ncbi:histidine kinase [Flavobacteriaceae bacterium F89]|uniref:histidine kinase n=1 Tax=Cerina litoralis TaxID=2874477 RepID=A0AAE3EUC8_9FLAO|nr:histidine kinase dimerization/phosphoacceptor domain -containing protein [Cerina litoralis]MCG2461285.1 histidine kinase [Cerina litoralis]
MINPFIKIGQFCFALILFTGVALAQDTSLDENILNKFKNQENVAGRFQFFYSTPNRYKENSAYDWLDAVNIYLNSAEKIKDSISAQQYKMMQAQIYFDLGEFDTSIAIAKELYENKAKMDLPTKKVLLDLMDDDYAKLKLYDKQLEVRQEKKDLGLTNSIAFYDIYANMGFYIKARNDYIMEMKKTVRDDDYFAKAKYHNNVGNYLRLDKSSSVALAKYKEAMGYLTVFLNNINQVKTEKEIVEGNLLKGIIEGNIGKCYTQLKQYEEAIPLLESSIATINEYNKGKFSSDVIENTLDLAECNLQLEKYKTVEDYLNDDLKPVSVENVIKMNRLYATYFDRIGDYKTSSDFLKKNARIRDSITTTDALLKQQQLKSLVGQDLANTRSMIDEQKLALERNRNEMQAKDERINLVFISLVFTLLGFAGMVYAYLKSIKNQRLIAEQKFIIENALVEKDSLLKEIHHRVKNNLQMVSSLLSLQTKNTRSKAAIVALEEGKSRVKAMALIHQKLYQNDDLSVIEMQGYIESLINSIQSVYKKGGHNINITIDAEGTELDIDRAIPFGLILNELVSNSFKYAFPEDDESGKIYIHLSKNGDKGFFEYSDNGIGLPEDTDERANSSMGIRLMNRLVNQLQSTLNIDKSTEGVRFWFNFK